MQFRVLFFFFFFFEEREFLLLCRRYSWPILSLANWMFLVELNASVCCRFMWLMFKLIFKAHLLYLFAFSCGKGSSTLFHRSVQFIQISYATNWQWLNYREVSLISRWTAFVFCNASSKQNFVKSKLCSRERRI